MTSKLILYGNHMSPPVRAVHLTLEALDLDYEFKTVDVFAGETKTPEFLKKNPQHCIPTLEEAGSLCIWDSHAIMAYLVRRYGKNDSLYPKDFYERAIVDQRLHYENGVLFTTICKDQLGQFLRGTVKPEQVPEMLKIVTEAYDLLELFLGDNDFMAGKNLTIADFSIISSLSAITAFAPIESDKYPKLDAWFSRIKKLPYYELVSAEGLRQLQDKLHAKLGEMA